jgi:NADH dehydrogenase/NADH:ubiquinone oxidoreductase subunit G
MRLCVRACREIVGVGAISLTYRGMQRTVSTPFQISSAD